MGAAGTTAGWVGYFARGFHVRCSGHGWSSGGSRGWPCPWGSRVARGGAGLSCPLFGDRSRAAAGAGTANRSLGATSRAGVWRRDGWRTDGDGAGRCSRGRCAACGRWRGERSGLCRKPGAQPGEGWTVAPGGGGASGGQGGRSGGCPVRLAGGCGHRTGGGARAGAQAADWAIPAGWGAGRSGTPSRAWRARARRLRTGRGASGVGHGARCGGGTGHRVPALRVEAMAERDRWRVDPPLECDGGRQGECQEQRERDGDRWQRGEREADHGEQDREVQQVDTEGEPAKVAERCALKCRPEESGVANAKEECNRRELALELKEGRGGGEFGMRKEPAHWFEDWPVLRGAHRQAEEKKDSASHRLPLAT